MFIREELHLPVPVDVVHDRILTQLQADGLHAASAAAFNSTLNDRDPTSRGQVDSPIPHNSGGDDGRASTAQQEDSHGSARETTAVTVQTLAPYQRGPSTIVPIRWFINDAGDGRPVLDANIEFGPAQTDATTLLLLVGTARSHIDHGHPENGHHHQVSRTIARTFLTTLARLQFPGPFPRSQPTP